MQSNFIYLAWIYELVPAVLTSIQLAFVRIKWWSPSEKYSMLAIISILLTNLESLNKTEIKQMAVCIVNKNKEKKKTYPSSTINSFQKINVEILTGSKKKKLLTYQI